MGKITNKDINLWHAEIENAVNELKEINNLNAGISVSNIKSALHAECFLLAVVESIVCYEYSEDVVYKANEMQDHLHQEV